MPILALAFNCTLKSAKSDQTSSTEKLLGQLAAELRKLDIETEIIRAVDRDIKPGTGHDMGSGDAWPVLREKLLAADILVIATPVWLGQPSSVAKRVLERIDAFIDELDDNNRMKTFGKIGMVVVVGNEDGAHHVAAEIYQAVNDLGFSLPPTAVTYWVGETMTGKEYSEFDNPPARILWKIHGLLVFAGCVFLFQMANASMLPLAGEAFAYSKEAFSSLIISALIMVPQIIVAIMAPWTGRRANMWGRRPLLLVGFAALPIRALVFASTTDPTILIVAQVLDGVSGTMLGVLTALTVADLTSGTGRFNLAQGFVGTISGIGASLSTTLSGLVAGSFGRSAGFLGLAAVALAALLVLWLLMPETHPSSRNARL